MVPVLYCIRGERKLPKPDRTLRERTTIALAKALKFAFLLLAGIVLTVGLLVALSLRAEESAADEPAAEEEVGEDPHLHH